MLDSPKREKAGHNFETEEGLKSGVTGMQGWRLDMEDDHILAPMASRRSHTLCAIFDGHGGDGAAKYAAKNLMEHIERTGFFCSPCVLENFRQTTHNLFTSVFTYSH